MRQVIRLWHLIILILDTMSDNSKKIFTGKRILSLIFLLLILAIAGVAITFRYPDIVKIKKTKVKRLEGKIMYVDAEVVIHNPNFFPINLQNFQNKILINKTQAAVAKRAKKISLKANGNTIVKLEVALDIKALAGIYPELKKQVLCEIDIEGKYAIDAFVTTLTVDGKNHKKVDLNKGGDQVANFAIGKDGLKVQKLKTRSSQKGMNISLDIGLQNNYPFDYKINTLDVNITPPDTEAKLGHWRLPQQKIIHAHTMEHLPVKFLIPGNKLITALSVMYAKKVQAIGSCQVVIADEIFDIPIKQSIALPAHQLVASQF